MKRNEDDEIQVLGETPRKELPPYLKWAAFSAVVLSGVLLYALYLHLKTGKEEPEKTDTVAVREDTESTKKGFPGPDETADDGGQPEDDNTPLLFPTVKGDAVSVIKDSINDVCIRLFALKDVKASLKIGLPDPGDTSLVMVIPAADVRRDNQEIVGDYVLDGKQLSRGKRKPGYVAIMDGKLSLGASSDDEILNTYIREGGSFLRQYALVIEGEIQANQLKGKSVRRAIASQGNHLYLVESCHRESLYDFSEALVDMGMTHAVYLTGGNSYGWYRTGNEWHELGSKEAVVYPNSNYILFRKQ